MAASTGDNECSETSNKMEETETLADTDGFIKVQSKRGKKRKAADDRMEVSSGIQAKKRPEFPPLRGEKLMETSKEIRRIRVPSNRFTPLKENWMKIFTPVVEHLKLQIRFNIKMRTVEIKASKETTDVNSLQRGEDFVKAFILGFDVEDALALMRLDELFVESFEIADVKSLKGDHLARAIGRIAGTGGKTKFTIENVTKTRIIMANTKIHILGSFQNIKLARTAICNLILGHPPSKVYGSMRSAAYKTSQRF